ncbi:MAG: M20 family metallopeptidase [Planctomycetota bacterium]
MSREISELAARVREQVIAWQRDIHAHPEIGFDTVRTAALAAAQLRKVGLKVREGVGRTGVVADLDVPGARRRIAFRADMDALPMDEENELSYRSTIPGRAHMCGHDAHTAMLLGAATALASSGAKLPTSVRFIFQPNEEALPGGAPAMIADGCLDGVDRIFGMHVWPIIDTGAVGIVEGPALAQPDTFRIVLDGTGGHAAAPHACADIVLAAAQIVTALQSIVARNVDPMESAVVSVTTLRFGTADNILPAHGEMRGTIRSFKSPVGELARTRLCEIATGVASALGVKATVEVALGYPVTNNDPESCRIAARALAGSIPQTPATPVLGGEDFAYYQQKIPGAFLFLGTRNTAKGLIYFCHHPRFQVDDPALEVGVRTWLHIALSGG